MYGIAEVNVNEMTKFLVKVGNKVIGEASSRTGADIIVSNLSENERLNAVIVPVAGQKEILLG